MSDLMTFFTPAPRLVYGGHPPASHRDTQGRGRSRLRDKSDRCTVETDGRSTVSDSQNEKVEGRTNGGKFAKGNKLGRGGPRPGGGRKPQAVKEVELSLLEKWGSSDNLDRYFARLNDLAADNDPNISIAAIKLLFDRVLGKATERKELTGADGGPLGVEMDLL